MTRLARLQVRILLAAPLVWEAWRIVNSLFDAWLIAQIHKAWGLPRERDR
ncbi:hypothetical protein [Dietzia alimentaria]|nr:hypothetical protein [Dietzia alimentaria]